MSVSVFYGLLTFALYSDINRRVRPSDGTTHPFGEKPGKSTEHDRRSHDDRPHTT